MTTPLDPRIEIVQGDITTIAVDAIVNAANRALCGGGGVDGAIHRAAGPALLAECRTLGGAKTGQSKITGGYNLPARHVIHTVGPVWEGGDADEDALLEQCYRTSLALVVEHGLTSIAFPAISTGAYRFPLKRATHIALTTVNQVVAEQPDIQRVVFCCFSALDLSIYHMVRDELAG